MQRSFVVIGAGYGDEAKGMTTVSIAEKNPGIQGIFRFNGGCQAGHTVAFGNHRIVNQSLNSGATCGISNTIYTPDVVVNPHVIECEIRENRNKFYVDHRVVVDAENPWTTVLDSTANKIISKFNGTNMTCGHGINETLRRDEVIPIKTANAMFGVDLYRKIQETQEYYRTRFEKLGITDYPFFYQKDASEHITRMLLSQSSNLSIVTSNEFKVDFGRTLIFEGAQGLRLDQEFGDFPYVTPSNTGLLNVVKYLRDNNPNSLITPVYCTRTFLTRHGDGPFNEDNPFVNEKFNYVDETNVANQFQGNFKIGILDIDALHDLIDKDMQRAISNSVNLIEPPVISLSHLDVLDHTPIRVKYKNKIEVVTNLREIIFMFKYRVMVFGHGPNVTQWNNYF